MPEAITPLLLEVQKKYKFTHILAGSGAFGKVSNSALHRDNVHERGGARVECNSPNSGQAGCGSYFRRDRHQRRGHICEDHLRWECSADSEVPRLCEGAHCERNSLPTS